MYKKSILALAAIVVGTTSAAFASEAPENKIGDKYPLLEQTYPKSSTKRSAVKYVTPRQTAIQRQYAKQVPENKIGDRYPLLEPPIVSQKTSTRIATGRRELTTGSIRRKQSQ